MKGEIMEKEAIEMTMEELLEFLKESGDGVMVSFTLDREQDSVPNRETGSCPQDKLRVDVSASDRTEPDNILSILEEEEDGE